MKRVYNNFKYSNLNVCCKNKDLASCDGSKADQATSGRYVLGWWVRWVIISDGSLWSWVSVRWPVTHLGIYYSARSYASAKYWIHFTARFGGVHAFGYYSAEPIWMKSGALWVHCRGLALAAFRRDLRSSDSWRARPNFLSAKQRTRFHKFPVGQILRNLNTTRRGVSRWKLSEQNCENFTVGVVFCETQKFI